MTGKFVSTTGEGGELTITRDDNGEQHTVHVTSNVHVTVNGEPSNMGELQDGDKINISGDPVSSVHAKRE